MAAGSGQFFPLFPFVFGNFVCEIKPKKKKKRGGAQDK